MADAEAVERQFAGVDALIAQAEAKAEALPPQPPVPPETLTEQERREVEAALVYGADRSADRPGEVA